MSGVLLRWVTPANRSWPAEPAATISAMSTEAMSGRTRRV